MSFSLKTLFLACTVAAISVFIYDTFRERKEPFLSIEVLTKIQNDIGWTVETGPRQGLYRRKHPSVIEASPGLPIALRNGAKVLWVEVPSDPNRIYSYILLENHSQEPAVLVLSRTKQEEEE